MAIIGMPYQTQTVTSPGETIADLLMEQNKTGAEFANEIGLPLKAIGLIISGQAAITLETAVLLERVLGVPADYWIKHENGYRESIARNDKADD